MFKKLFYKYILRRKYYRYGQCNRCGACCSKIYVNHGKVFIQTVEEFEKLKKLHPFYIYIERYVDDYDVFIKDEKHIKTVKDIFNHVLQKYGLIINDSKTKLEEFPFYTYIEVVDKDDNGLVFKCNKFDKEKHICTIHKKRPAICRKYPSEIIFKMGAAIGEQCGYYFKPIDSFEEVLAKQLKNLNKFICIF